MSGLKRRTDGVTCGITGQRVLPVKRTAHSTKNVWRKLIKKNNERWTNDLWQEQYQNEWH